MTTHFPPSRLTCERCHGFGHVRTGFGKVPCLECSTAASPWIPASRPPAHEPNPTRSDYIECVGVLVTDHDGIRLPEIVTYWPLRGRWTMSRPVDGCWDDVEVEISHWFELPELPALEITGE